MSLAQAVHVPVRSLQPLAWPVAGGKTKFGSAAGGEEDTQALHRFGTKIWVPRGETIFNQGDAAEYAYKVISGAVRLCRHLSDGRRQIAQFLFPGDFFNIIATGGNGLTAEAVSDAVLMSFPQRQLQKFREERASVQERFMTLLSQRVLDAQNHLMVLGRQTATERVASFLVLLWERIGDEEDDVVDVPMSRLDIADYLGLTIETVCRVLSSLKRKRIIGIPSMRQLTLRDIDSLQALADGAD
jgi:CRP-like cAMP-binding protein